VDDAADYLAITRLQAAYGDAVTRRAWNELVPMFLPDCTVRLDLGNGRLEEHSGPEALGAFIAASVERFECFVFTLLNAVVEIDGDVAHGRLYIQELRQERDNHQWTTAVGLYRDRYRRMDGRWRFAARDYSSIARTSAGQPSATVFAVPGAG
jgi:hypothetical protein